MDFQKYSSELITEKINIDDEKLKKTISHKLKMKGDFKSFFESNEVLKILNEFEENANLKELLDYERWLNDAKFWY